MSMSTQERRIGRVLIIAAIAFGAASQWVPIYTVDVYYHLAVGDWIIEHHTVPTLGLFSATRADTAWVDNEWGFQMLLALADHALGVAGIMLLSTLCVTLALSIGARILVERGVPAAGVAALTALMGVGLVPLTARPQNLTYLFAMAFSWAGLRLYDGRRLPVYVIPLLMVAWVNLHAGFIVGWLILGTLTVGAAFERADDAQRPRRMALALATSILASFVNPYGWKQVWYPIAYALNPGMTDFNMEWQATKIVSEPAFLVVALLAIVAFARAERVRPHDLLWCAGFLYFGAKGRRHVGLATLLSTVAVAPYAAAMLRTWLARRPQRPAVTGVVTAMFIVVVFVGLGRVPEAAAMRPDPRVAIPAEAADFIAETGLSGPIFNQYRWGAYLLMRFGDANIPFVDGRNDLYGEALMRDYLTVLDGRQGYRGVLDRYGLNTVLLELSDENWRILRLLCDDGWVCVHHSRDAGSGILILVRPVAEMAGIIAEHGRVISIPPPPAK